MDRLVLKVCQRLFRKLVLGSAELAAGLVAGRGVLVQVSVKETFGPCPAHSWLSCIFLGSSQTHIFRNHFSNLFWKF